MSLEYRLIRAAHVNKNTLHLTSLFNMFNIQSGETIKATARKAKILGEFGQSNMNVNDRAQSFGFRSKFMFSKYAKEPYPDIRCWVIFDHMNKTIQDLSLYDNSPIYETGYPCLTIGDDSGLYGRNLATILNRTETILEYYRIPHNSTIDFDDAAFSSGFTILLIFKPYAFHFLPIGSPESTVFQKINDANATGGVTVRMSVDGRLKFYVRESGTDYDHISKPYKLRIQAYNHVVLSYDPLGFPRTKMIINGEITDFDAEGWTEPEWSTPPANRDAYFALGNNQNSGKAWIGLQEYRLYKGALTTTQMLNLFQNKLTIEGNAYGETAWLGYTRFPIPVTETAGYDSVAFDGGGYDIT